MRKIILTTAIALALTASPAIAKDNTPQAKLGDNLIGGLIALIGIGGLLSFGGSAASGMIDPNTTETVGGWATTYGKKLKKKPGKPTGNTRERNSTQSSNSKPSPGRKRAEVQKPYFAREYSVSTAKNKKGNFNEAYAAGFDNPLGANTFNAKSYLYRGFEYGLLQVASDNWEVEIRTTDPDKTFRYCYETFNNQNSAHDWAEDEVDMLLADMGLEDWDSLKPPAGCVVKGEVPKSDNFSDFDLNELDDLNEEDCPF